MKKRLTALLLAATVALSAIGMTSCSKKEEASGDLLTQIQEKGEITIAMEGTWAPWTYHDEDDKLVGFDTEVGEQIAAKLGVEANFVECEWDGIFGGLDSGRYDIAINGIEVTDERSEKYNFSTPYAYIRTALIVRGDNEDIKTFEDLNGKSTANSISSTYMTLAESYGATAVGVDTLDETMEQVISGRVDATLNAEVSFYDYLGVHPDANVKCVALTDEASLVSIPVRKDPSTDTLLAEINKAIEELRADGTLAQISEKYFGSDITAE